MSTSSIPKAKVANAINVPNGTIVPQLREQILKEGDLQERRVYRPRAREVVALQDAFVQDCYRKMGDKFVLTGEEEINPEVLQVLSDTPAMEGILRPVLVEHGATQAAKVEPKKKSSIPNELPMPGVPGS